jgi:hypothetical protein
MGNGIPMKMARPANKVFPHPIPRASYICAPNSGKAKPNRLRGKSLKKTARGNPRIEGSLSEHSRRGHDAGGVCKGIDKVQGDGKARGQVRDLHVHQQLELVLTSRP